jgi:Flp pilus assembly protein TadD
LTLFQKPASQLASIDPKSDKKPISRLPSGVTDLVASAQRHFAAREFDEAEKDYLEILRRDENNVYTLANLAAIQMERGSLADAEKNAAKAVAGAPQDDYSLTILGQVKFRQERYDDALDAFNRAAKLKPQSAELQNYLGVVLGHKGLRDPAEQALRRAIVLNPGYADAHYNLAVFYGTKDSSFVNLAKWHYQRATAGGHPPSADLEKLFESKASVVAPK